MANAYRSLQIILTRRIYSAVDEKKIFGEKRIRSRELGIKIGRWNPGPLNAITDVPGVLVGHETIMHGEPFNDTVKGIARTGVTVVFPRKNIFDDYVYAGSYSLNGNGEMTGLLWVDESGLLTTPIALTNTHSVGVVRDSMIAWYFDKYPDSSLKWMMPVVAETWDGYLNDINGMHVNNQHVFKALNRASAGSVAEGSVGGGTGMTCYEFKGGIGTSSRLLPLCGSNYTVGTLVQANYGRRYQLRVNGVPVGENISTKEVPGRQDLEDPELPKTHEGSIIVIIATNAPLLADQCKRLARRAAMGLARIGSYSADNSGDIFFAFSTGNNIRGGLASDNGEFFNVQTIGHDDISVLFEAVVESVEESILNALCAASTITGIQNQTAFALPLDKFAEIMEHYGRT
jgi:D-aminopeptidase